jgi:uncharacterized protein YjbI with pentapeptide repeats
VLNLIPSQSTSQTRVNAVRAKPRERSWAGSNLVDADLSGADLSGVDLSGADLSRADLSGANLQLATLKDACLYGAKLDHTCLDGATLTGANLQLVTGCETGMVGALLSHASLLGATLPNLSLTSADLRHADLTRANLSGARMQNVNLTDAQLFGADLNAADLSSTQVHGASFHEANLRGATLSKMTGYASADWVGADIRDVNFAGAYLARRHIRDANYLHEFRHRSRTSAWVYRLWWLTSDCGRSIGRWALCVAGLIAIFAVLYGQLDIDYGDHISPLSDLYFSVVTITSLGYGDILPASGAAQAAVILQAMLGYVMLGGLASILATKMGRRAD